jgi:glycosyltransferase involved in cell wall biosynthesis
MTIGVTGHIKVRFFLEHLYGDVNEYSDWGIGGTQVSQVSLELMRRGHDLVIVTLDPNASSEVILEGKNIRICIGPYREKIRYRMADVFYNERKYVKKALIRESPDIVHAHWTYEYALAALSTSIPTVVTIRDWAPAILLNTPPWPFRFLKLLMAMYVFFKGTYFTANSPYIGDKVKAWFGWDIPVIPNALEDKHFIGTGVTRDLSSEQPTLVSINNGFGKRKNVSTLLRAFSVVTEYMPEVQLRLYGYGYERGGKAHSWASSHDLAEGVQFRGEIPHDKVIPTLRRSDILVHPAREESFGNTLVEAMSQKTPVIAGRNSGAVPWVLDQGGAGILTDVTNPKALANAILDLAGSATRWRKYSEKGFKHAWSIFRLSVTVGQFLDMYENVTE